MDALVVGASGLLGSTFAKLLTDAGWEVTGTHRSSKPRLDIDWVQLDLQNQNRFEAVCAAADADVVFNCAAVTDVDACENSPTLASLVNAEAPARLARVCDRQERRFVHVSTDYVFDGRSEARYSEYHRTNPIQEYGQTKLAGEQAVLRATDAMVIRVSFLWGWHYNEQQLAGFPAWLFDATADGQQSLFWDQQVTPTEAQTAVRTTVELLNRNRTGLYHIAATDCVSPYAFGRLLVDEDRITAGYLSDVDRDAERPKHTCLDTTRVQYATGSGLPTVADEVGKLASADRFPERFYRSEMAESRPTTNR